ncbi:DUF559 domain-containing protein [Herbiconiux sp. 11R-BC]|uniref:endonuclease domain-containing protein n=1 Tax=Herbiconiux sp. 11R-BC TaxID=3111637 RepID=UPI003C086E3F
MHTSALSTVESLGGVASITSLTTEGVTSRELTAAVNRGDLVRVRRGWFALAGADPRAVAAVRVGGTLSCTTLLRRHKVWCADDSRLHVRVSPKAGRVSSPFDRARPLSTHHPVLLHRPGWARPAKAPVDDMATALALAVTCQHRLDALVTLDSALNRELISRSGLQDALAPLPAKYRQLLALVDPASQSGLETKARVTLRSRRIRIRSQVLIPGVGHVDLLLGDRLVLELNGHEWHSKKADFEEDRRRDLELTRLGYLVVRLSYAQVMWQWPECEAVILELVRDRKHLWPRRA